ncbi:hypothetical protein [Nostoc sp. TCL26-01]|uniref:hypothetical protein n=1 Tax=Nostoc sp. TCL26-01 TaxID=2576904 RepID=UPI0015C16DF9|nr:hypothetical protein [Nostoc sp. TCL26-01]QLE57150.1 hypothetical protein FD725_17455 [Nostoc sp. TCL26-01]
MTKKDETISQIRKIRHLISQENGHNPQTLVNYYIELQKQYPHLIQYNQQIKLLKSPPSEGIEA